MSNIPSIAPIKAFVSSKRLAVFDFEFYPQFWHDPKSTHYYRGRRWQHVFFNDSNRAKIPAESGIYMFVVAPRHARLRDHTYIFYVGQAVDLKVRYGEYLQEMRGEKPTDRPRVVDFLNYFKGHIYLNYTLVPQGELDTAEDFLVDYITPWANTRTKVRAKLGSPVNA